MTWEYLDRSVEKWLAAAESGTLELPSFQRSFVWKPQRIADYLSALFQEKPTGVFLVLKVGREPPFESRSLKKISGQSEGERAEITELLLDGQQRLTSLWQSFAGAAKESYFLQVKDICGRNLKVVGIKFKSGQAAERLEEPRKAYVENLAPIRILREASSGDPNNQIWDWCRNAVDDPDEARQLERELTKVGKKLLKHELHYCELGTGTKPRNAIDIFIESNKSAVNVTKFDIAVAVAEAEGKLKLRDGIISFQRRSPVIPHYTGAKENDPEAGLPPLGKWTLFAGCLGHLDKQPKESQYDSVVKHVLLGDSGDPIDNLTHWLNNVEEALKTLSDHGARTEQTLPALPPLHVLAALEDDLKQLSGAHREGFGKQLVSAYIWRSFFTDRYEARANDRLYKDFGPLRACIQDLAITGRLRRDLVRKVPIFDEKEHSLPKYRDLANLGNHPLPWIKIKSRLSRAIVALQLSSDPVDWITTTKLNTRNIRELEREAKLHRHHIFPVNVLKSHLDKPHYDHALNGAVLKSSTNLSLDDKEPQDYLREILHYGGARSEAELKKRIESHLVPYDLLVSEGNLKTRYKKFIQGRARLMLQRIEDVCALPRISQ